MTHTSKTEGAVLTIIKGVFNPEHASVKGVVCNLSPIVNA